MADLAESLKKLALPRRALNQTTDAVNAPFRKAEEYLEGTCIGLEARVPVCELMSYDSTVKNGSADDHIVQVGEHLSLSYTRIAGRFRLALEQWNTTLGGEEGDTQVLSEGKAWDQARAWKLAGIVALPRLVEEIVRKAEKLVNEADAAQSALTAVLADLSKIK
ncbi:MAG: hypothetical protein IPN03_08820 [Holophagales bacterium]|nr:hypothetical protein [Holophagales bacterium]